MVRLYLAAFLVLLLSGCEEIPITEDAALPLVEGVAPQSTFATVCAACHGEKGEGKLELKSPSIASLPSWYVIEQIDKFKKGFRGTHAEDIPGNQMRAIAMVLNDEQLKSAAAAIEKMEPVLTEITDTGNVKRGRQIFAQSCMACHRFSGSGERAFHSAPLISLDPDYIKRQLENYAKGWRGSVETDFYGHKMYKVGTGLSDRDITDLVRYIGELAHGDDPRKAMDW